MGQFFLFSRQAAVAFSLILFFALSGQAAEPKKPPSMEFDNKTVGVFGSHHSTGDQAPPAIALPSRPVAAMPTPKVEAEAPTVSMAPTVPSSLPAAPRPEASIEGGPTPDLATQRPISGGANGFLANHLFISGLVAGLIGSDLGAQLYGGPMMGDESAANLGLLARFALVALLAWRLIAGLAPRLLTTEASPYGPIKEQREPTFERNQETGGGRREPRL